MTVPRTLTFCFPRENSFLWAFLPGTVGESFLPLPAVIYGKRNFAHHAQVEEEVLLVLQDSTTSEASQISCLGGFPDDNCAHIRYCWREYPLVITKTSHGYSMITPPAYLIFIHFIHHLCSMHAIAQNW